MYVFLLPSTSLYSNYYLISGLLKLQKMKTAAKEDDAEAVMDAGAELLFPHAYLESRAENGQTQMYAPLISSLSSSLFFLFLVLVSFFFSFAIC